MKNSKPQKNIGILISNLGTPAALTKTAVKEYLQEFLSDRHVVNIPAIFWKPILHTLVLTTRPAISYHAYEKIWTEQGSPLAVNTQKLLAGLRRLLLDAKDNLQVELGMRYGEPSLENALNKFKDKNLHKLIILPLYPQFSNSTTASTCAKVNTLLKSWDNAPPAILVKHYFDNSYYINAITDKIKNHWKTQGRGEKLLISFHGMPARHSKKGDPYYSQCLRTVKLIAKKLKLKKKDYLMVFQSRFGSQRWLQPYCDETLLTLAQQGYKNIDIICPGFATDCLETLEEISLRYNDLFKELGGEKLNYIPALNDDEQHLNMLSNIIFSHIKS